MEIISFIIDVFVHLDRHLAEVVQNYGAWTYGLLALIIFAETGLVFTPFLPGDSLLFAAGAMTAIAELDFVILFVLLGGAAILGDTANYWIGRRFGGYLIRRHPRWVKQEHLDRTHAFFEKYGGKTIVIARFVPFVRTFAPFVAGLGAMGYQRFFAYNVVGGVAWVMICLGAGRLFGNIPVVKENFSLVVLAIVVISVIPVVIGWLGASAARRTPRARSRGGQF